MIACKHKRIDVVNALVKGGANVEHQKPVSSHAAAMSVIHTMLHIMMASGETLELSTVKIYV